MSDDGAAKQQPLPPIETLYAQVREHRLVLQGMAIHLEKLQGEVWQGQKAFAELLDWLESAAEPKEATDAGDAPTPTEG